MGPQSDSMREVAEARGGGHRERAEVGAAACLSANVTVTGGRLPLGRQPCGVGAECARDVSSIHWASGSRTEWLLKAEVLFSSNSKHQRMF